MFGKKWTYGFFNRNRFLRASNMGIEKYSWFYQVVLELYIKNYRNFRPITRGSNNHVSTHKFYSIIEVKY